MKLLQKMTGLASVATCFLLAAPQQAEAQFWWHRDSGRSQNLVERLSGLEQYSTLVDAVTAAGLGDTLAEIDRATIFAPTNEAFAKIPEESLSALLADPEQLTNLLTYHVVPGYLPSSYLGNRTITALNGDELKFDTDFFRSGWFFSRSITINGSSKIVRANQRASNGLIHGIDTVLDPAFETPKTILETAAGNDDLSILAKLVESAGFDRALDNEHLELTVFAPSNEAFAKLPADVLEAVQNDRDLLRFVLRNHIVRGSVESSDLETGTVRTVGRTTLDVVVSEEAITVGPATVVVPDVLASNGVVHVIDEVLLPEQLETLVGIVESRDDLATFKVALDAAGLTFIFDQESRFWKWTIFAPNNEAFAAIPTDALAALLEDRGALLRVLFRHVAFGKVTSEQLSDGGIVRTLGGRLAVEISEDGVTFNGASLAEADLKASNGILHIVSDVIPASAPEEDDDEEDEEDDEDGEDEENEEEGGE